MDPLATIDQYKSYLRREPDDTGQALLLLDGVSGDIRSYCGWSISAENGVVWTVDSYGSTVLALPTLHLRDVTAVTVDGTALNVDDDVEWSEFGYLVKPGCWPRKLRSVVVTVDHGYDPVPPEIVTVVCSMVSRLAPTAGTGSASSVSIGDYSETRPSANALTGSVGPDTLGASPTEKAVLDRYRIALRS